MSTLAFKPNGRRRPFRVLRRLANEVMADNAGRDAARSHGRAVRAQRIARNWYGLDQMELPLGPLTRSQVTAVCEALLQTVNGAVAYQFRVPFEVLGHLVACQTEAYRASFEAKRRDVRETPAAVKAALAKYQKAAGNLNRVLERYS